MHPRSEQVSGEGGIRTHGDHESHNGFRDRPVQPLRHLSSGGNYTRYLLDLSYIVQLGVVDVSNAVFLELVHKYPGCVFFSMNKEDVFHTTLHGQSVIEQQLLTGVRG